MALDFPSIDPVAFSLGPLVERWYALAYLAGFLLGWKYIVYLISKHPEHPKPDKLAIEDFVPWAVLGVILGGRIGYTLFYKPAYYFANPGEIFHIWQGGMAFHGGALGVILAMILFARFKNISFLRLADLVCCAVPIGLFFGRLANFINGELYGRVSDVAWAVKFPTGGFVPRHPSQLYEAMTEGLVLFLILLILQSRSEIRARCGFLSAVFLMGYAVARIGVEFFREPDAHLGFVFAFISMGQLLSIPMIVFALGLMIYVFKNSAQAKN